MDTWAKATPKDRKALFNQTASVKGISPEIVEKDFWVCWVLYWIFHLQGLPRLIFKGRHIVIESIWNYQPVFRRH